MSLSEPSRSCQAPVKTEENEASPDVNMPAQGGPAYPGYSAPDGTATSSWPRRRQTRTLRRGAAAGSLGELRRGAVLVVLLTRAGGGGGDLPRWITPRSAATLRFLMKGLLFGEDRSAKRRDLQIEQVHLLVLLHLAKSTAATRISAMIGTTIGGTRCVKCIPSRLLFVSKT